MPSKMTRNPQAWRDLNEDIQEYLKMKAEFIVESKRDSRLSVSRGENGVVVTGDMTMADETREHTMRKLQDEMAKGL